MKNVIIGRQKEQNILKSLKESAKSEFVALYGRRRVGKTYLIREFFANGFTFQFSGLANATTKEQLIHFNMSIRRQAQKDILMPKNWLEAFEQLMDFVETSSQERKIIFLDELPWLARHTTFQFHSGIRTFLERLRIGKTRHPAHRLRLGYFMDDRQLINNHGGLHNRITCKILLEPFTLNECEAYFKAMNMDYNRYQIAQCYMVMGGIPFYLSMLQKGLSVSQNIDRLFFENNAQLRNEFSNLYAALFRNSEDYVKVVEAMSKKNKGISRDEISKASKIPSSGGLL